MVFRPPVSTTSEYVQETPYSSMNSTFLSFSFRDTLFLFLLLYYSLFIFFFLSLFLSFSLFLTLSLVLYHSRCQHKELQILNTHLSEFICYSWELSFFRIEKTRTVLPRLVELIEAGYNERRINWSYFYDLLFTRENIRLVHIVCHDKTEHTSMKLDEKQFFRH